MKETSGPALLVLASLNFFALLCRYTLPAVQVNIQHDYHLVDHQVGMISSAYSLAFALGSPLLILIGPRVSPKHLLIFGSAACALITLFAGLARSSPQLVLCRFLLGFVQAVLSITVLAVVPDLFSLEKRIKAITVLLLSTPLGASAGSLIGGIGLQKGDWHSVFIIAGLLALIPLIMLPRLFPQLTASSARSGAESAQPFSRLFQSTSYRLVLLAGVSSFFALSGFSIWLPTYLHRYGGLLPAAASLRASELAFCCGISGILFGAKLAQALERRRHEARLLVTAAGLGACGLASAATLLAGPDTITVGIAAAEICFFTTAAALNSALLSSVTKDLRVGAVAVYTFTVHLFGDAVAPLTLGFISDRYSLRAAFSLTALVLFSGSAVLALGHKKAVDSLTSMATIE